jgi:hypothetical protein
VDLTVLIDGHHSDDGLGVTVVVLGVEVSYEIKIVHRVTTIRSVLMIRVHRPAEPQHRRSAVPP